MKHKLKIKDLAKLFQVDPATIYRWRRNKGFPKPYAGVWDIEKVKKWAEENEKPIYEEVQFTPEQEERIKELAREVLKEGK